MSIEVVGPEAPVYEPYRALAEGCRAVLPLLTRGDPDLNCMRVTLDIPRKSPVLWHDPGGQDRAVIARTLSSDRGGRRLMLFARHAELDGTEAVRRLDDACRAAPCDGAFSEMMVGPWFVALRRFIGRPTRLVLMIDGEGRYGSYAGVPAMLDPLSRIAARMEPGTERRLVQAPMSKDPLSAHERLQLAELHAEIGLDHETLAEIFRPEMYDIVLRREAGVALVTNGLGYAVFGLAAPLG